MFGCKWRKRKEKKRWRRKEMIEKMFLWYMFESREGKEKEKWKMFVCFAKAEKWKEENILITLIPSLIGEVSKRPSRQNCNFERNKKSKNAAAFLHSTFLSISAQFGRIGKSGPGRIWENEILCFLLSSQPNSRNTIPSLLFLPFQAHHERERRKSAWN